MGGRLSLNAGTLKLDGGKLTLDWGTRPSYNLSTSFVCFQLYVCSHFIVQYYSALSDRAWYGMEDDFFIFQTSNFLPFHIPIHIKNLPFYIPFHTKIFVLISFHTFHTKTNLDRKLCVICIVLLQP